jgi:hypothetical protein
MSVTYGVIDLLQTNFFNRISLVDAIPGMDGDTAAMIVAESLEADRVWNLPPDKLLAGYAQRPENDFKSAILAEILFETSDVAFKEKLQEAEGNYWALAMASLEQIARSPTASPLLWYEDIYFELAQGAQKDSPEESLDWHKRSLAHNLLFNEGESGVQILRDLAESHLFKGDLERGLRMLAALLHHTPDDIWTYNLMAITFDKLGLTQLGSQAIQRGLQLINAKGDEEQLRQQFENYMIAMQNSSLHGREADVSPRVIDIFQEALALDFDAGQRQPIIDLCRELVPDLDLIPVKSPLKPAQIPLPDPEETFQLLSRLVALPPKKRTHRGKRKSKRSGD